MDLTSLFPLTVLSLSLSFLPPQALTFLALLSLLAFSPAAASRLLTSSSPGHAGPTLPLVGAAFEEGSGGDSASAVSGQVSAEVFRGGSGISDAAEAVAAAAGEPLPEGSPDLSAAAVAAPAAAAAAAVETPVAEATTTPLPTPPPPPSSTPLPPPPPSTSSSPSTSPLLPPLAVSPDGHLTAGGKTIELRGLNWFGFEAGQTFVDGTSWSGSGSALSHDALSVLWRIKLLGFNAVRLPFSFLEFEKAPRDVTSKCDRVGDAEIARSVTPAGVELSPEALAAVPPLFASSSSNEGHGGGATDPPPTVTPAPGEQGLWEHKVTCNADVPTSSVKDRLLWLVKKCVAAGLYVILDDHISYDTLILDDPAKWVQSWRFLAADLAQDRGLEGAVMLVRKKMTFFSSFFLG